MNIKLNLSNKFVILLVVILAGAWIGACYFSYTMGQQNGVVVGYNNGLLVGQRETVRVLGTGICEQNQTITCPNGKVCACFEVN